MLRVSHIANIYSAALACTQVARHRRGNRSLPESPAPASAHTKGTATNVHVPQANGDVQPGHTQVGHGGFAAGTVMQPSTPINTANPPPFSQPLQQGGFSAGGTQQPQQQDPVNMKQMMSELSKRLDVLQHAYVSERSARMAYQRRNNEVVTVEAPLVAEVIQRRRTTPKTPPSMADGNILLSQQPIAAFTTGAHASRPGPGDSAHIRMGVPAGASGLVPPQHIPAAAFQQGIRGDIQLFVSRLRHRFREWVVGGPLPATFMGGHGQLHSPFPGAGFGNRPARPVPSAATMVQRREGTAAAAAAALLGVVSPETTAAAFPSMLLQDENAPLPSYIDQLLAMPAAMALLWQHEEAKRTGVAPYPIQRPLPGR